MSFTAYFTIQMLYDKSRLLHQLELYLLGSYLSSLVTTHSYEHFTHGSTLRSERKSTSQRLWYRL